MRQQFTNLYPSFHVIPFQHLYQRLSEEAVDVVIAFWNGEVKKAIHYQELIKIPLVGVVGDQSFLGGKKALKLCDLKQVPIIVLDPQKCPDEYRKFLHPILDDHSTVGVYFCNAVEAAVTLSQAGYGVAILPDFFLNRTPSLRYIPIAEADPISYGVYYKTIAGHPVRRLFLKSVKDYFAETWLSEQSATQN
jgi:DNA-binding transcriptional LysR family regulator